MNRKLINFSTSPWIVSLLVTIMIALVLSLRIVYCPAIYASVVIFIFLIQKIFLIRFHFEEGLRQKLIRLELNSIKSRMNPHFIYNVMSTLSNLVLSGDKSNAYNCIVKFSDLMRGTFKNSGATAIALKEELALVEKYIQLQWLRFSGNFDFDIKVDEDVNLSKKIPRSIIITFVEFAINHRLFQMQSGGQLNIHVFVEDNKTMIHVKDNGTIKASDSKISSKKPGADLSLIDELLLLINKQNSQKANYQIENVLNKYNQPQGTLVSINIPNNNFNPAIDLPEK